MALKSGGLKILQVVLPGDEVLQFSPNGNNERIILGPGLRWHENNICATRSGLLKKASKNFYYVDSHQKRYIPHEKEFVIGIILRKKGDNYLIDIGGNEPGTISCLAFENSSKKSRKEMKPGDLIFGQLLVANRDMEPELVCIDVFNKTVSMESLPDDGIMFTVPLHVARMIVNPENIYLMSIAKKINYTVIVGFNGRVWLKTEKQRDMVAIMNCIMMLEFMSLEEAEKNVFRLLDSFLVPVQH
ncbi:exosome complex component RRP40-like [Homarus americanus]|uniref:exosome complex component RRP40-like n=1 Tax=Homarus americanus TaxID=6706 RepID=UPI001C45F1BD|nr:exosome complex component RRP40-like [Homarus americanus]